MIHFRSTLIVVGTVASGLLCLLMGGLVLMSAVALGSLVLAPLLLLARLIQSLPALKSADDGELEPGVEEDWKARKAYFEKRLRRFDRAAMKSKAAQSTAANPGTYGLPALSYRDFLSDGAGGIPLVLVLLYALTSPRWSDDQIELIKNTLSSSPLSALVGLAMIMVLAIPVGAVINGATWFLLGQLLLWIEAWLLRKRHSPFVGFLMGATFERHGVNRLIPFVESPEGSFSWRRLRRVLGVVAFHMESYTRERRAASVRGLYILLRGFFLTSILIVILLFLAPGVGIGGIWALLLLGLGVASVVLAGMTKLYYDTWQFSHWMILSAPDIGTGEEATPAGDRDGPGGAASPAGEAPRGSRESRKEARKGSKGRRPKRDKGKQD